MLARELWCSQCSHRLRNLALGTIYEHHMLHCSTWTSQCVFLASLCLSCKNMQKKRQPTLLIEPNGYRGEGWGKAAVSARKHSDFHPPACKHSDLHPSACKHSDFHPSACKHSPFGMASLCSGLFLVRSALFLVLLGRHIAAKKEKLKKRA